jgi:hypothetical protein
MKNLELDRAAELFEKSKKCEITRYNITNKSTFLHIFDYHQNKELKKLSKLTEMNRDLCLYLYAPDVESYARLSYEISEIERMKADFMLNKKKYFDRKVNDDLIAYDNNLQVNDLVDNATSKTVNNIRKNKLFKRGMEIGNDLKRKLREGQDKKVEQNVQNFIKMGRGGGKKLGDPKLNKAEDFLNKENDDTDVLLSDYEDGMLEGEEDSEGGGSEYEERDLEGEGSEEGDVMMEAKGGFPKMFTRKITEKPGSLEDSDEEED